MPATFQTYYTSAPMRARPFLFALTLSDRSDGKTFNIKEIRTISQVSDKKLDVHLMVENPLLYIENIKVIK